MLARNFVETMQQELWRLGSEGRRGYGGVAQPGTAARVLKKYAQGRGPLKTFRREAVLAGFRAHHAAHDICHGGHGRRASAARRAGGGRRPDDVL